VATLTLCVLPNPYHNGVMETPHLPVLLNEVLAALLPEGRTVERVIDGTLGAAGHTKALLDAGARQVLGLDLDPQALGIAREALKGYGERTVIRHASYVTMRDEAAKIGWGDGVDGILLDLGVSSMQLDIAGRGFAFMKEGPLDMRFDPEGDRPTAAFLVNHWDAGELADIFYRYGEDREGRRLAKAIVANRPYSTTRQLAEVIERALPRRPGVKQIHPATRVFQALRIAVNDELREIERALPIAIDLLRPGGRLAIISFHSLEDRIVKQTFREASTEIVSPPGMMLEEKAAVVKLVTRKPVEAAEEEIARNPRSRSAKLRVVEKL
jgi:16S rRNA (cytosine1402-N4)-methyltransferase